MVESSDQNSVLQRLLRHAGSDDDALNELLRHSCDQLTRLTHRMLGGFPGVQRWAETADVLQNALLRLSSALRAVKPQTPGEFLALASLQIRRELIDLARSYHGPQGLGTRHKSWPALDNAPEKSDLTHEPSSLAQWAELHEQIGALPAAERTVVELLYYQGLPQADAAQLLNVSVRTVQRSWHSALVKLHEIWKGELPKL